jgi:hypothetical protein
MKLLVSLTVALFGAPSFLVPAGAAAQAAAPAVTIPCFSHRLDRYVARSRPDSCVFFGRREIGPLARFPIHGIEWEAWGSARPVGTGGVDPILHHRMRVMVYERVRCGGDGARYTMANVYDTHTGANVLIRLPGCPT